MARTTHGIEAGENALLIGAKHGRYTSYDVKRLYDDGSGPVWIYQDASGLLGIVRAETWEKAYDIVMDEILDDADPDYLANPGYDVPEDELPEGCEYRPSGAGSNPWNQTAIYQEDLNGSQLELLTPEHMENHGIVLKWQTWGEQD
jgi:hypothetical protein